MPPDLEHVIVSGDNAHGHDRFEDVINGAKAESFTAPTTRDDIAFWLYTSGSTGKPKGAVHVHANLRLTNDLYAGPMLGMRESDVVLFGRQAVLCLWPRQRADLPDVGRRDDGAAGRPPDAGRRRGAAAQASGHGVLRRADLLRGLSRQRRHAPHAPR